MSRKLHLTVSEECCEKLAELANECGVDLDKLFESLLEAYRGSEDYKAFRSYLENRLREKLKRIEDLLVEIGCNYP